MTQHDDAQDATNTAMWAS